MCHAVPGLLLSLVIVSSATPQLPAQAAESDQGVNLRIVQPSAQVVRHAESLNSRLQPTTKAWILEQARSESQSSTPNLDSLNAMIRQHLAASGASWPGFPVTAPGSAQQDVDALALMVMMKATQDNEDDLRSQMASLQAMDQQKSAERKLLADLNSELARGNRQNLACTSPVCRSFAGPASFINQASANMGRPSRFEASADMSYQQVANLQMQLSQNLQSMNELSDMTSMKLQMTMDRRSKFIQMLSNIEKKISSGSSAIVQNLK
jgi:hypothetical protein